MTNSILRPRIEPDPKTEHRPRILVADDHAIVLEGLRRVLEPDYDILGEVSDGLALVTASKELDPDVIVADVSMPLLNGIEAVRQIHKSGLRSKVVFLSMHPDIVYVSEAFLAGGSAYVLKSSAGFEILTAIQEVLQERTYITPSITSSITSSDVHAQIVLDRSREKVQSLSTRRRQVVQMTAEGNSTKKIAHILKISPRTVEFHRYRAMSALGLHSIAELVQYAIKNRLINP